MIVGKKVRRRTRNDQASIRVTAHSFNNFIKIAAVLNNVVSARNNDMWLVFTRIQSLIVVYQNYPEYLVPDTEYAIPFTYTVNQREKKVHLKTETDFNGAVMAFNVLAMSNQTNHELLTFVRQLPDPVRLA